MKCKKCVNCKLSYNCNQLDNYGYCYKNCSDKAKKMLEKLYEIVNMGEDDVEYSLFRNHNESDIYGTCGNIDTLIEQLRNNLDEYIIWEEENNEK